MTMKAEVLDIAPAQFRRMRRDQDAGPQVASSILDDCADAIEAVHQLANLAGFSERPRAFVLALASAARSRENFQVELFDKELADLQNCSVKTVQRQRKEYLLEARGAKLGLVEIIEGEFVKSAVGEDGNVSGENLPTLYRFHLAGPVERVVTRARASNLWHDTDRRKQRKAIARAAALVFDEIPRSGSHSHRKRKPRPAAKEIKTCLKAAATKLRRALEIAAKLPPHKRAELLDETLDGEDLRTLRQFWLDTREAVDSLFDNSPQAVDNARVDEGGGQLVQQPDGAIEEEAEPSGEDLRTWDRTFSGLTEPPVRSVVVPLRPPPPDESPPGDSLAVEELEAEAIRAEACGGL